MNTQTIYCIGIGGIGISALAAFFHANGKQVRGEDLTQSTITDLLQTKGIDVHIGAPASDKIIQESDLVIYSTAVPQNHPAMSIARQKGIPIKSYPEMLGGISQDYFTIAVSGMHGKSTTTAMIGLMLESAGKNPLVIVGTLVPSWKSNIRIPAQTNKEMPQKKPIFVVEADEYKESFMHLHPDIIVLTRVEEDHLDYYKDLEHIKTVFSSYVKNISHGGYIVANEEDTNIREIMEKNTSVRYFSYAREKDTVQKLQSIIRVPGRHTIENALATWCVGQLCGLTEMEILRGISSFTGTWRRMEHVGAYHLPNTDDSVPIISDYGHHPTEIKATLQAIKEEYPHNRIVLAYQPHQHNRTKTLFTEFVHAFGSADILILCEIFDVAGREEDPDQDVSSRDLVRELIKEGHKTPQSCVYAEDLKKIEYAICQHVKKNDILVIMGAGDIDSIARTLSTAPSKAIET